MTSWLLVFIGGGLGSLARFGLSSMNPSESGFPLGTFLSNMAACMILGLLLSMQTKEDMTTSWWLLAATGFCGGFSTFSTYSGETIKMIQSGETSTAAIYVVSSLLMGLVAVYLGYKVHSLV